MYKTEGQQPLRYDPNEQESQVAQQQPRPAGSRRGAESDGRKHHESAQAPDAGFRRMATVCTLEGPAFTYLHTYKTATISSIFFPLVDDDGENRLQKMLMGKLAGSEWEENLRCAAEGG